MLSNRSRLIASAILGLVLVIAGQAHAGFIGDVVTITSDSQFSGDPTTTSVTVASPAVELPGGFGSTNLAENLSINIESSSIELIATKSFGIGNLIFQGLHFTGLDSPGESITGFSVDTNFGYFLETDITFGPNSLNIDLQNQGFQSYKPGNRITINLQLTPTAVPEPASFITMGIGALGLLGCRWRRRLLP